MPDIKEQKLLYHLTSLENLSSIFQSGLKPRAQLKAFEDVADAEILKKRQGLALEQYVPFHWFAANPFDGSVQRRRPDAQFVVITVHRNLAIRNNGKSFPAIHWLTMPFSCSIMLRASRRSIGSS
nr:DUF4433 domain-containing protein [Pseudomonas grimontii]